MSLIGTAIGALVALLPRPTLDKANPRFLAGYEAGLRDGRLEAKEEKLDRSHRQLVDHIQSLERELLIEQHLCAHWKAEAERQARQSREAREMQQYQGLQALAQHQQALAQQAFYQQQSFVNQQAGLAQLGYDGFCNCVPSRAQVWSAEQRDFPGQRIERNRP